MSRKIRLQCLFGASKFPGQLRIAYRSQVGMGHRVTLEVDEPRSSELLNLAPGELVDDRITGGDRSHIPRVGASDILGGHKRRRFEPKAGQDRIGHGQKIIKAIVKCDDDRFGWRRLQAGADVGPVRQRDGRVAVVMQRLHLRLKSIGRDVELGVSDGTNAVIDQNGNRHGDRNGDIKTNLIGERGGRPGKRGDLPGNAICSGRRVGRQIDQNIPVVPVRARLHCDRHSGTHIRRRHTSWTGECKTQDCIGRGRAGDLVAQSNGLPVAGVGRGETGGLKGIRDVGRLNGRNGAIHLELPEGVAVLGAPRCAIHANVAPGPR